MSTDDETPFAPDFKETPYWWDAAAPTKGEPRTPPARADVAIVGAGLIGTSIAWRRAIDGTRRE